MSAIYSWLAAPTNLGQVNFINLALALFGSFATIVGFGLTAWQLMRTVKATKAATDAVARIKSRVASYDAVFEISRATASLKETERHLKRHSWEEAIVSYGELRTAVVRLR